MCIRDRSIIDEIIVIAYSIVQLKIINIKCRNFFKAASTMFNNRRNKCTDSCTKRERIISNMGNVHGVCD